VQRRDTRNSVRRIRPTFLIGQQGNEGLCGMPHARLIPSEGRWTGLEIEAGVPGIIDRQMEAAELPYGSRLALFLLRGAVVFSTDVRTIGSTAPLPPLGKIYRMGKFLAAKRVGCRTTHWQEQFRPHLSVADPGTSFAQIRMKMIERKRSTVLFRCRQAVRQYTTVFCDSTLGGRIRKEG